MVTISSLLYPLQHSILQQPPYCAFWFGKIFRAFSAPSLSIAESQIYAFFFFVLPMYQQEEVRERWQYENLQLQSTFLPKIHSKIPINHLFVYCGTIKNN